LRHELLRLTTAADGLAALHAGRVQLEPYQLVPVTRLLAGPHRNLLIADDVGLGKTIEAGLCLVELMARGVGRRALLVVPPGLLDQWVEEMQRRFGLAFKAIADSASLDHAQTALADGVSPWAFHDRVITSTEYLKRPEVHAAALRRPWDVVVVDEAHYLAESGSPASPYSTRRTRLGRVLRAATRSLLLLTATPHNGYRHSFRSLLELIEPTDATLEGDPAAVRQRVGRAMVRRLKPQITRSAADGTRGPAFVPRAPVERIEVACETADEREVFALVSRYCTRTVAAAAGSVESDLVSFAMQIVKKRMLSSRLALARTVAHRLDALKEGAKQAAGNEGPSRAEVRELQGDLPLPEREAERIVERVLRSAVPPDARRRNAEKRQLQEIRRALERVANRPDPKVERLVADLRARVLAESGEKAIVFTEYRDTLEAIRQAFAAAPELASAWVELPGGLTARQRRERIAAFAAPECRVLLATDAASEGLNLQRYCRRLYHVELPWNPNRLEQRSGRIDRYGQRRTPQVAYLFYADSPEDRVLDRLVTRIGQMQTDRVSTPDILGLVEATRLPERLLAIGRDEDAEEAAASLVRVFDEEHGAFLRDVAPLLAAGAADEGALDASSADPMLADDLEFERAMLRALGPGARPTGRSGEYRVTVPIALQGAGVPADFPALTFRRSVALADGMEATECVHRLHPLARAAAADARATLLAGVPGVVLPPCLAVRRLAGAGGGAFAVFTFVDRGAHPEGALLAVGVDADGDDIAPDVVARALAGDDRPGEVSWPECEQAFATAFPVLRAAAERAAAATLAERTAAERRRRAAAGVQLRAEIEAYRRDRVAELAREEAAERAGTRDQTDLFRATSTDWDARRAAVATTADTRLRDLAAWEAVPDAPPPEPLGVLLVFPAGRAAGGAA